MRFTVLDWNIGGAKFLEKKTRQERQQIRTNINEALIKILKRADFGPQPDVVTLQEIVRYKEPSDELVQEIIDDIPGYDYFPFPLIDSNILSSKAKWSKIMKESDWDSDAYFAQGNAFLIKKGTPLFPVWDLSNLSQPSPIKKNKHLIEKVHLDSGLYFGDRNTEPRAALVAHFIYPNPARISKEKNTNDSKPLDIFVVNLHLTTLMMEREGVPEIDTLATKMRLNQLNIIFNGIVSRYNCWRQGGYRDRGDKRDEESHETFNRHSPIWIIMGDFNFTEESTEYAFIKRLNFIDTVPNQRKVSEFGKGTKASGISNDPTLNLDYIFAGPKFVSLNPAIEEHGLHSNRVIHDREVRASDHCPVLSSMTFIPL